METPKIYYEQDADLSLIQNKKIAVIGYGSQGHAHALNLKDSGMDVVVGLREDSSSKAKAEAEGLQVKTVAEASQWADIVMMLAPDQHQKKIYTEEIVPYLEAGNTLIFLSRFSSLLTAFRRLKIGLHTWYSASTLPQNNSFR